CLYLGGRQRPLRIQSIYLPTTAGCGLKGRISMYEVIVIGGGPAGVTAALRARELGANVALVERGRMGGVCTYDGCTPTRVLAKAARLVRDAEQFAEYGLGSCTPTVDWPALLT